MPEIIHLGDESTETYFVADYLLDRGYSVSVVGHGESMEPVIPDKTRMVIKPKREGRGIVKGAPVFCVFGSFGYNVHKVAKIKRKRSGTWYVIKSQDEKITFGEVKDDRIRGVYAGRMVGDRFIPEL